MSNDWPRLSESLPGERSPVKCQSCGITSMRNANRWQEHDDNDQPEPIAIVLCEKCSKELIDPHPRLYRKLDRYEPFPGTMMLCWDCPERDGVRCKSLLLRSNGGPGIRFPKPDTTIHVDGIDKGRRFAKWLKAWSKEPEKCEGKPA